MVLNKDRHKCDLVQLRDVEVTPLLQEASQHVRA
jgi:hypothetical protein